jgi:hypothetical protein
MRIMRYQQFAKPDHRRRVLTRINERIAELGKKLREIDD